MKEFKFEFSSEHNFSDLLKFRNIKMVSRSNILNGFFSYKTNFKLDGGGGGDDKLEVFFKYGVVLNFRTSFHPLNVD